MRILYKEEKNAYHNYGHWIHDNLIYIFAYLKKKHLINLDNTLYINSRLKKWNMTLEPIHINISYDKCDNPDYIIENPFNYFRKNKIKIPGDKDYNKLIENNNNEIIKTHVTLCNESIEIIPEFANYYFSRLNIKKDNYLKKYEKNILFIDRKIENSGRCILNRETFIEELNNYCNNKNYKLNIIDFSELSFKDQIYHVNNNNIITGYFGAGFSNTIFCTNNPKVIEILPSNWDYINHKLYSNAKEYITFNLPKDQCECTTRLKKAYIKCKLSPSLPKSRDQDAYIYLKNIEHLL